MDDLEALERAYRHAEAVISRIPPGAMDRPTPCPEWDVRALLRHLVGAVAAFPEMLRGEPPDWSANLVGDDAVASFRTAADANLAAWRAPGALDTPVGMLPGMRLFDLNLVDAVVHTWDLATATDQDSRIDAELAEQVFATWRAAPLDRSRAAGAFGPEVEVPPDAPITDRLVALLGRRP